MPHERKVQDDILLDLLDKGVSTEQMARSFNVTQQSVTRRIRSLQNRAVVKNERAVTAAAASMWDTRTAAEANYQRALALIDECETATEKTRLLGEIRQHLQFGMQVIETLYTVQETKEFMEEVLAVIGEIDADARKTILTRLAEKRTLRAAFLPR